MKGRSGGQKSRNEDWVGEALFSYFQKKRLFRAKGIKGLLDLLGSAACLGTEGGPGQFAILDEEGLTLGHPDHRIGRNGKGGRHLPIRVGNESEREIPVRLELFLSGGCILAHTEDLQSLCMESLVGIAQGTGFSSAARGLGLGVKIDQGDSLGIDIREVDTLTILIHGSDLGSRGADGQGIDGLCVGE